MNSRMKAIAFNLLILLIVFVPFSVNAQTAGTKRLYGKIVISGSGQPPSSQRIVVPLRYMKVEIVEISQEHEKSRKSKKPKAVTYPDMNGNFVFRDIPEMNYYIQVSREGLEGGKYVDYKVYQNKISVRYNNIGQQRLRPITLTTIASISVHPEYSRNVQKK